MQPIIGQAGVAAIYNRSLYLAAYRYHWLPPDHGGLAAGLSALKTQLKRQAAAEALASGAAHLEAFQTILAGLMGALLVEQLLSVVRHPDEARPPGATVGSDG